VKEMDPKKNPMERKPFPTKTLAEGNGRPPSQPPKTPPAFAPPAAPAPEWTDAGQSDQEAAQRVEQIWAERAIQLAQVNTSNQDQGEQATVVVLRLGRELLGLEAQYVFDIRAREAVTRVPRVPNWVVGVTNLRGNILSVIDLCKYFGLPTAPDRDPQSGILIIVRANSDDPHAQNNAMEIVFLVDDVLSVETIPIRQNAVDSGLIHNLRPEYIQFIGERQSNTESQGETAIHIQRHIVILNIENLLQDPRLIVHDEIA